MLRKMFILGLLLIATVAYGQISNLAVEPGTRWLTEPRAQQVSYAQGYIDGSLNSTMAIQDGSLGQLPMSKNLADITFYETMKRLRAMTLGSGDVLYSPSPENVADGITSFYRNSSNLDVCLSSAADFVLTHHYHDSIRPLRYAKNSGGTKCEN